MFEQYMAADLALCQVAKDIKILSYLNWPIQAKQVFLEGYQKGKASFPEIRYQPLSYEREKAILRDIQKKCSNGDPVGRYLYSTAENYILCASMLEATGTEQFGALSRQIYSQPRNPILNQSLTHLDIAENILAVTEEVKDYYSYDESSVCILPETVAAEIRQVIEQVMPDRAVQVVLDQSLSSKAAAGAERVRIRSSTCFSRYDIDQLIQHELLVHSLTAINGRLQRNLTSFSLSAPRTLETQEGLAVFAEFVTHSIDLRRLRALALRVKAIDMGLEGANFIEVFEYFLSQGFSESESFASTSRVFRGGDVRGGSVFTKDCVYLTGLNEVHVFMKKAIQEGRIDYPRYLFAGRLSLGDVIDFEELFVEGFLSPPRYLPEWAADRSTLTAFLLYSSFIGSFDVQGFKLEDFSNK